MSLLRDGLHVVRRDDRHLQIGVDPPWRVIAPDDPDVHRVLADLAADRWPRPASTSGHRLLRDLTTAGMLRPDPPAGGRVALAGAAAPCAEAARLLTAPGTRLVDDPDESDVVLVLAAGEPPRDLLDDHLREGRAHLVVGAGATGHRVGPFVVPGATACQRCVDAHLGEGDPRRAVVVEQLGGVPATPGDAALAALAVAWAVRDVQAYVAGSRPTTWSATVDLGLELSPRPRTWQRHPYCGCAWDALAG
ncbi:MULTISPECIES: hypothetical protein [unclassified Nocardioides]|uniref:hypothetical protein n=1 Tax=unclassified Nocardioides TaxID=2615069 RepID=UPI003621F17A